MKTRTRHGLTALGLVTAVGLATVSICAVEGKRAPRQPRPAEPDTPSVEELRKGKSFVETRVYTAQADEELLALFAGLRVADLVDGMDKAGLKNVGLMSPEIHPLWKDLQHFSHRIVGIAVTVRYVPTDQPHAPKMDTKAFNAWASKWYGERSGEPFVPLIRKGTVVVIEDAPYADVGSIGSNNLMVWKLKGCVGVITSATARDTDEIAAQRIPLYLRQVGRGIRPGRNEVESVNRPIVVGGVLVQPGDVVAADGDGVLVVPRAAAREVATFARETLASDKQSRRNLYQQLGLPPDDSVK
jgi:4-hydroxy-4-methyl-2-oxoglutarate aldolase